MNSVDTDPAARIAELEAQLAEQAQQVEALQTEIDETNRGVVALYAELDVQAQQLQRATDLKSRFLSYMSHEFRTPISAIRSLSRLLLDQVDGPLAPEQAKQVGFIDSTAKEYEDRGEFARAISGLYPTPIAFGFRSKPLAEAVAATLGAMRADGSLPALLDRYGVSGWTEGYTVVGP